MAVRHLVVYSFEELPSSSRSRGTVPYNGMFTAGQIHGRQALQPVRYTCMHIAYRRVFQIHKYCLEHRLGATLPSFWTRRMGCAAGETRRTGRTWETWHPCVAEYVNGHRSLQGPISQLTY